MKKDKKTKKPTVMTIDIPPIGKVLVIKKKGDTLFIEYRLSQEFS